MSDTPIKGRPAAAASPNLAGLLVRRALDEIYASRRPAESSPRGKKLHDTVARTIGDCPLTYLEFGVHKGSSIRQIASRFPNPAARFVGFDSFEGLPEAWGGMEPGTFSTGGETPVTQDSRIRFVKGWFQNTVPGFLAEAPITGPVLVHFDADLYSSTLFLLTTLWHHIPAYFFLFDEYVPSEIVAMYDFQRAYPVEFEYTAETVNEHRQPWNIFGRLRNVAFRLPELPTPAERRSPV